MTDTNIWQAFDTYYDEAYYAWSPYYPLANRDLRFYLGDQWDPNEKKQLYQEGRNAFVFNRARRNINLIEGYQRKNRLSSVVSPVENSDQKTADQLSQLLLYTLTENDGYYYISDAFSGALKTGWNLLSIYVDYRDDPVDGDIKIDRLPYNSFITDPYFSKSDFSDCQYILFRKYMNLTDAKSLLPGFESELESLYRLGWSRDDKFNWLPYQVQPNGEDLLAYNEFWEQKYRNVPVLVDMETGQQIEFDKKDGRIRELMRMFPQLKMISRPKRYVEKHIIVNETYLKTEENPYGLNEYPFVPFFAIFEPESDDWGLKVQSLMRCMIDPQREANRRRSQMIDILDSQINSGWIADEHSVINPHSLFQSSQGKVIWRSADAKPGSLEKIPPAHIDGSMFQLQQLFDNDMMEIVGVNDAGFGMTENPQESGVAMLLRQGASVINLQNVFDYLRRSQKSLSHKIVKLIQDWSPAKVKRILNEEPTAQFYSKEFTKYDVTIKEGVLTDTQQQMYYRQLLELKREGGLVTSEMLSEAAPIQGKSKYVEQIKQMEQQQNAIAERQMQLQNEEIISRRQEREAKAISDIALSKERFTRAVANMGLEDERSSQSIQDRSDAALARAKTMKELQGIDIENLQKYFNIVRLMEESNKAQERDLKTDNVNISAQGGQSAPQNVVPPLADIQEDFFQQQPNEVTNERL